MCVEYFEKFCAKVTNNRSIICVPDIVENIGLKLVTFGSICLSLYNGHSGQSVVPYELCPGRE